MDNRLVKEKLESAAYILSCVRDVIQLVASADDAKIPMLGTVGGVANIMDYMINDAETDLNHAIKELYNVKENLDGGEK